MTGCIGRFFLRCAGVFITACFLFLSAFEASLALDVPLVGQVYEHENTNQDILTLLRCASVVASVLWLFAAIIFVHQSQLIDCGLSNDIVNLTAWGITAGWSICSVVYFLSDNVAERKALCPITFGLALICLYISSHENPNGDDEEEEAEQDCQYVVMPRQVVIKTTKVAVRQQDGLETPLLQAHTGIQIV